MLGLGPAAEQQLGGRVNAGIRVFQIEHAGPGDDGSLERVRQRGRPHLGPGQEIRLALDWDRYPAATADP